MNNVINTAIIEKYLKDNSLSKTKFCKMCKIQVSTYNRILSDKVFGIVALFKMAKVMNIQVHKLFKK